jgi:hypothetical protein
LIGHCAFNNSFAQLWVRSSSPSFNGPLEFFTMNPSGGIANSPPFFWSFSAIGLAAYPNTFSKILNKRDFVSIAEILVSKAATLTPLRRSGGILSRNLVMVFIGLNAWVGEPTRLSCQDL